MTADRRREEQEDLASLKAKVYIADLIGRHVALKRCGSNVLEGLCPFHDDHSPSLQIDTRWQNFRCWSCGARGDALDFVARIEDLDIGQGFRCVERGAVSG